MEYHSGGSLPLLGRPRYCPGANANGGYLCETGHCCGESGCCTYYYELWWFWLLWTLLILFSCCCAYRHRRAKLRVQQQQRQREISLLAYHGANSYPSSMLDLSFLASLKLPSYEEVAAQPSTPPPPYSSVFTAPRYPQPPRTVDPHLLTQHGPLLHHPFSDGPSSLSSDNSSSCSCDSCCPSSPCSSSLSAPVTYETDTSHASTPSEAAPLTLDLTLERITTVASCLEVTENQSASERTADSVAVDISEADSARAQEPVVSDTSVPTQTVTVAVVTRGASPQPSPSPGSEGDLPLGTTSPAKQQLDTKPCTPLASTCSSSMPSPNVHDAPLPCNHNVSVEGEAGGHEMTSAPQPSSTFSVPSPTESTCDRPGVNLTPDTLHSTRTFCTASLPSSPTLAEVERTLALITDSPGPPLLDPSPSLVPIPAASNPLKAPVIVPSNHTVTPVPVPTNQAGDSVPVNLNQNSELTPSNDPHSAFSPVLTPCGGLPTDSAAMSPTFAPLKRQGLSPESVITQVPLGPLSDLSQRAGVSAAVTTGQDPGTLAGELGPCSVLAQLSKSDIIGPLQSKGQSGSGSSSASAPLITFPSSASSSPCPAITVDSESVFTPVQSPTSALSSPSSLPSPPFPSFPSALPATTLAPGFLLDPINALHQSEKGGSSSGHASSLSPSPRTTQSPPKQTLFSPCVDVFEPGPPNWEDEDEEEQEEDNEEDEDDDMGADESQYRHRRLTGDSGIEVCRCRVEKEEDDDEEEEEKKVKDKACRGEGGTGERNKKENGGSDLHDSIDCPARGHMTTVEDLTRCNPSSTTASSDDCGEVVIVMERV